MKRIKQNALGLTTKEATKRLFEYGENRLQSEKKISALKIFAGQFRDLMIMILLASTVISVIMGEVVEAIAIIIIVLLNAILGFVQEFRTERTLEALKSMAAPAAIAIRDGYSVEVPAHEIVPGDVILLKAGNKVPADAVILEAVSLSCDEAMLSGESIPVDKIESGNPDGEIPLPGSGGMVYMGTVVTKGRGTARVVATGMSTEMGKIAGMLSEIEEEATPLQKRLAQLGKYIAAGCLIICAVVAAVGVLRGEPFFNMLIIGISLAVAAVPEGLPAIVTIALALAVNRILRRNALVRRLHAVETMGCANVICTDKTGTLTENKMTVKQIFTLDYQIDVSGIGYERGGELTIGGRRVNPSASPSLRELLDIAVTCNNSQIIPVDEPVSRDRSANMTSHGWTVSGEPTEIALLIMGAKANFTQASASYEREGEIPFDSDRKRMSVVARDKSGERCVLTKGGPDILLSCCKYYLTDSGVHILTPALKSRILKANEDMAAKALRVLGFAYKKLDHGEKESEDELIFVGLAGMIDPPRKEAYEAVERCRLAKIRTVMITGDHMATACAIAKDLGILRKGDTVMTGAEIDELDDDTFARNVHKVSVFARVNPGHKLKIVRALKRRGNIVGMTGDGVNDAPAIKEADIGVAMGITGTDVTKQAASIILLDDNFATLVAAIEEGRVVYNNIRKFIRYLLSCNIGEVVTMFLGMLMGMPVILLPIQILLVNLATDGLPAIALGLEPADPEVMRTKPRAANESVFSNGLLEVIAFRGILIGLTTLAVFSAFIRRFSDVDVARTGALLALVLTQLFHVFECKSETRSLFSVKFFNNIPLLLAAGISGALIFGTIYVPALQFIFSTVALSLPQLVTVFSYSLIAPCLSAVILGLSRERKKKQIQKDMKAIVSQ